MAEAIGWLDNLWGHPDQLGVPISDRGLRLAEGVFETLLVRGGQAQLLDQHLQRWNQGAHLLGLPQPPPRQQVLQWLNGAVQRSGIANGALRLNWSWGSDGGRGLAMAAKPAAGRCWGSLYPHTPNFQPQSAWVCRGVRRWADSPLSGCKSFAYTEMLLALAEAQAAGAGDALLLSSRGGLCCGSSANLLVWRQHRWLTPPLASGCLAGIMRGRALELSLAEEAPLGDTLEPGEAAVLLNSLDCRPLNAAAAPLAEALFEQLLAASPGGSGSDNKEKPKFLD